MPSRIQNSYYEFVTWVTNRIPNWIRIFLRQYLSSKELTAIASYTSRSIGLWSQNALTPQMEVNRNRVLGSLPMWLRSWNDISPTFKSCSVSPLTISLSLSLSLGQNELINRKINRWISIENLVKMKERKKNLEQIQSWNVSNFESRIPKKKERIEHFQIFTTTYAWNSSINLSPQ